MKMTLWLMAAACVAAVWSVRAATHTWSPASGTLFQEAANWSPSAVPGAADTAVFSGANTYAVTFNGNVTNAGVTVGSPVAGTDAAFDLNGWLWTITGTFGFGAAGSAGVATFGNGALEVENNVNIWNAQKLILNGGTSLFKNRMITQVGGVIEVGGGSHVFGPSKPEEAAAKGLLLYSSPLGGPSLRVTNGIVRVTDQLTTVIDHKVDISLEGGTLRNESGAYGFVMEGPGTLDVHSNAVLDIRGKRCYFGRRKGLSTLNILGGAVSNTAPANAHVGSAYAPGSTSVVNLVDGIFYSSGSMGFAGTSGAQTNAVGILRQSGGRVHMGSTLQFGYGVGSVGIYTQSGGTAWCNQLRLGDNNGSGSQGLVYLAGGTLALNSPPYLGSGNGCTGCIYQTGGELLVSNWVHVGAATNAFGLYHFKGGNAQINSSVTLGYVTSGSGQMIIEDSGLSVAGRVDIGYGESSTGELVVAGGSFALPTGEQNIGRGSNSLGRLCVTGGEMTFGNDVYVGAAGGAQGGVYLTDGVLASYGTSHGYRLGQVSGATGELVVAGGQLRALNRYSILAGCAEGAYGSVTISGGTNDIRSLRIGHQGGQGLLRITGGKTYVTNEVDYTFTFANAGVSPLSRLELAGGVLTTRAITGGGSYTEALFDGGVLQCACDNASFFQGFNLASLTARGAIIDTDGYAVSISQAFANEAGYAGSITKQGEGTLTLLSAGNTFTGLVTVTKGELAAGPNARLYLNGGVVVEERASLNLAAGMLRTFTTSPGTVSRIDGTLILPGPDGTLTNGGGATLCGGGVVTGSVVFASGSAWAHGKAWGAASAGPLRVTGNVTLEEGVTVALTGYSVDDLKAGVPLLQAAGTGTLQVPGLIPVTLDGASHRYWWAKMSNDGKTLSAAFIPMGTMIRLL